MQAAVDDGMTLSVCDEMEKKNPSFFSFMTLIKSMQNLCGD